MYNWPSAAPFRETDYDLSERILWFEPSWQRSLEPPILT